MIRLTVLYALLKHIHWLALCMLARYVNRDFFTHTQLKYNNKYALEIRYDWLSFYSMQIPVRTWVRHSGCQHKPQTECLNNKKEYYYPLGTPNLSILCNVIKHS